MVRRTPAEKCEPHNYLNDLRSMQRSMWPYNVGFFVDSAKITVKDIKDCKTRRFWVQSPLLLSFHLSLYPQDVMYQKLGAK